MMQEQISGEIQKMKALERWENEGGRVRPDSTSLAKGPAPGTPYPTLSLLRPAQSRPRFISDKVGCEKVNT